MDASSENTLDKDVTNALKNYLRMKNELPEHKKQELLQALIQKVNQAASKEQGNHERDPVKQLSIAIEQCPHDREHARQRKALRLAEMEARKKATLSACPSMGIQFLDRSWNEYYLGGSNKYPNVGEMTPELCDDNLVQKLILFDLLQREKAICCAFEPPDLTGLTNKASNYPAIIIPSSGKDGKWLSSHAKFIVNSLPKPFIRD